MRSVLAPSRDSFTNWLWCSPLPCPYRLCVSDQKVPRVECLQLFLMLRLFLSSKPPALPFPVIPRMQTPWKGLVFSKWTFRKWPNLCQRLELDICSDTSMFISIQNINWLQDLWRLQMDNGQLLDWGLFSALDAILMKFHVTNSSIVGPQFKHNCLKQNGFNTLEQ